MLVFAPDASDITPEILTALSAVPTIRGYRNPPAGVATADDAFVGTSTGGARLIDRSGASRTFVGTSTYLYELSGGSWTDRSRAGNYSSGSDRWDFCQFGDTELAINKSTQLQQSSTAAFSNVANSPKATVMFAVNGQVMLLNCDDTSCSTGTSYGSQGDRWWVSQQYNPTGSWDPTAGTASAANLATTGQLVETEGVLTAGARLRNDAVAYKDSSIYVGRPVGAPIVIQWQVVSKDVGCPARDALVSVGDMHYFIGQNDIYSFDGSVPRPLGGAIREWFFGRLNRSHQANVQALHDKASKVIYWFYPSGSTATLNSVLALHYDSGRFGAFDLTVAEVIETVTDVITYETLGNLYSTYNDLPAISYDDPFWNAATPILAYLDGSNNVMSLSGTNSTMTMTTGWSGGEDGMRLCRKVRPRFRTAPTSGTLTPSYVFNLGDSPTSNTSVTLHDGRFDVLQTARYHKFALSLSGSSEIEAINPDLLPISTE